MHLVRCQPMLALSSAGYLTRRCSSPQVAAHLLHPVGSRRNEAASTLPSLEGKAGKRLGRCWLDQLCKQHMSQLQCLADSKAEALSSTWAVQCYELWLRLAAWGPHELQSGLRRHYWLWRRAPLFIDAHCAYRGLPG